MGLQKPPKYEYTYIDGLKGESLIRLRYASNRTIIVHCQNIYGKRKLLKVPIKLHIRVEDEWLPYPVAVLKDGQTRVFGRHTFRWEILVSPTGQPDELLIKNLKDQDILVEKL